MAQERFRDATSLSASLRRGFSWSLLSTLANAACQWLVVVAIARLGTSVLLGQYALALAVSGPVVMLARLNMRTVLATDAANSYRFGDYFSARLILSALGVLLIAVYGFAETANMKAYLVLIGVALYKAIESLSDIIFGLLQRQQRFAEIGKSTLAHGVTLVACIAASLVLGLGIVVGVFAAAFVWLIILLLYDRRVAKAAGALWVSRNWTVIGHLIKDCIPTGLVMMLGSLSVNIPVYFIDGELGLKQVGYYSSVAYFMTLGGLVSTAISQSVAGHMANLFFSDRALYWRSLAALIGYSLPLLVIAMGCAAIFGDRLLALVYGQEYAQLNVLLLWLVLATGLSVLSAFLGLALTIARRFGYELMLTLSSVAVVGMVAFWAVPTRGLSGAAMAVTAGVVIRVVLGAFVLYHKVFKNQGERTALP
jgi:O-antigen/teichoic acid export membrane protein